ncbi:MAG: hypothetical protein ACPHFO_01960, partial [Acidimicrobiales bacterium]
MGAIAATAIPKEKYTTLIALNTNQRWWGPAIAASEQTDPPTTALPEGDQPRSRTVNLLGEQTRRWVFP